MSDYLMSPGFSVASTDDINESVYSATMTTEEDIVSKEKAILTWLYNCFPEFSKNIDFVIFMADWCHNDDCIRYVFIFGNRLILIFKK